MYEVTHGGLTLRSHISMPPWLPPLAVNYFRHVGGGPSDQLFANVVALDALFPPEWGKSQRRERFTRMANNVVEIDGRFVLTTYLRPARTKSLYEKRRAILVKAGVLPPQSLPAGFSPQVESAAGASFSAAARNTVATLPTGPVEQMLAEILARLRRLENPSAPAPLQTTSLTSVAASCAPQPVGALDWPPESLTTQWRARMRGPRLSRPLFALRVETYEEDQARALAALGRPAAPRGPLAAPEWSLADCAARAARCYALSCALAADAGLPALPAAPPPTGWHDMGACLTWTDAGLMRLLDKHPGLWERWLHPELVEPEDER